MSQSHGIKGGTTHKAFQLEVFRWERGASVVAVVFLFLSFKISNKYIHTEGKGEKNAK